MKGTKHEVTAVEGGVEISNIEDGHYYCLLETAAEVEELIKSLRKAKQEIFGRDHSRWAIRGDGYAGSGPINAGPVLD